MKIKLLMNDLSQAQDSSGRFVSRETASSFCFSKERWSLRKLSFIFTG